MANLVEVKVPDIGDFKDVAVIELLVKPGEVIAVDTGADHGRVRQGLDGDSVEPCRRRSRSSRSSSATRSAKAR